MGWGVRLWALLGGGERARRDSSRCPRQFFILDGFAEPSRIIACLPMMFPGAIINSGRHLDEHRQIVRSEIERVVRAAEVEAAVRSKTALGVFAGVSFMLLLRAIKAQGARVARRAVIDAFVVVGLWQARR